LTAERLFDRNETGCHFLFSNDSSERTAPVVTPEPFASTQKGWSSEGRVSTEVEVIDFLSLVNTSSSEMPQWKVISFFDK
jgi:hypothetical protein